LSGDPIELSEAAQLLFDRGPEAMSVVCATVKDADLRKSPANRILDVAPSEGGQAKNWLLKLPYLLREDVLKSHAIPPDSFRLLEIGDNDAFLARRMEFFTILEHEFMASVNVTPSSSSAPALSPIDLEDQPPLDFYG
jgi:hypothetical protein